MSDNLNLAIAILQDSNMKLSNLSGKHNGAMRQRLLTALLGYTVTVSDAGINKLEREFYSVAGIPEGSAAAMRVAFNDWMHNMDLPSAI